LRFNGEEVAVNVGATSMIMDSSLEVTSLDDWRT
jgi:hypothetical protein